MKTAQIMSRPFRDSSIRQNHSTGWFNATDMVKAGNKYRSALGETTKLVSEYFRLDSTREFIKTILDKENLTEVYKTAKGKNGGTWVHPLLLIDIAMWLSPEFKYDALKYLEDELCKHRDLSGDSYKKVSNYLVATNKVPLAHIGTIMPKIAKYIKNHLQVDDWNKESDIKLKQRDTVHNNFIMLMDADVEPNKALKIAVEKALEIKE